MARKLTHFEECLNGILGIVGTILIIGSLIYAHVTDHQTSIDRMTDDEVVDAQVKQALKEYRGR